jgi:hypothetical protein
MNFPKITKEKINPTSLALQQVRAYVVGTQVIYVQYDFLIDQEQVYLVGDSQ